MYICNNNITNVYRIVHINYIIKKLLKQCQFFSKVFYTAAASLLSSLNHINTRNINNSYFNYIRWRSNNKGNKMFNDLAVELVIGRTCQVCFVS